jgi:hypothetical protein
VSHGTVGCTSTLGVIQLQTPFGNAFWSRAH